MSYEGSTEFLCANGHRSVVDCHDDDPEKCHWCGSPMTHVHSIDHTNGIEEGNPGTMPAPKEQIGADDDWRTDHHGNRYAVAIPKFKPLSEWRDC